MRPNAVCSLRTTGILQQAQLVCASNLPDFVCDCWSSFGCIWLHADFGPAEQPRPSGLPVTGVLCTICCWTTPSHPQQNNLALPLGPQSFDSSAMKCLNRTKKRASSVINRQALNWRLKNKFNRKQTKRKHFPGTFTKYTDNNEKQSQGIYNKNQNFRNIVFHFI